MSATLSFDGGDLAPTELTEALGALPDVLDSKLEQAAKNVGQFIAGAARESAPVDTGDLRSRISAVVESVGEAIVEIRVGTNREGAAAQEFGTDPGHFPPPSALRDWARRVLGDPDAAYPVAKSISETGLEAQPYLRPAFEENLERALDMIVDAVDDAFAEVGLA
jgi:HK97 gp10 family phage protein